MSDNRPACPVCGQKFSSTLAMQTHHAQKHRALPPVTAVVPDSTIDGSTPELRCENCRYWGKANNLTVCRLKPGVPAMIQTQMGTQCVSLFPPALANEWCGAHARAYSATN